MEQTNTEASNGEQGRGSMSQRHPRLYSVKEAASEYHVSASLLYREIRAGHLKAIVRRGCTRGLRVTDQNMVEWLDSQFEVYDWEAAR